MSNSQNEKNEQQNNLCTMSLTEQWKKGNLPEGFYYVNDGADVTIDYYLCDYWERHFDRDIQEVLAPVPSYKEHQEEQKSLKVLAEAYCKEKEENQQLKELLKECLNEIHELAEIQDNRSVTIYNFLSAELLTKIDNAIGEKK